MTAPVLSRTEKPVLGRLRLRARRAILLEGCALAVAAAALFGWLSWVLDRSLRLEVGYRAALLLLAVAGIVWLLRRRLWQPLAVRLDEDELALALERVRPDLRQELISGVQFERALAGGTARGDSSMGLMTRVVAQMQARLPELRAATALDRRRARGYLATLGGAAAVILLPLLLAPETAALWLRRNLLLQDVAWPRATTLAFLDAPQGQLRIAEGDDLTVRVAASGVVPEQVELHCEFAGGERSTEPMARIGGEFSATLSALIEPVTLVATGGDGETGELAVLLVPRPRLEELQIQITPPEYIGAQPRPFDPAEGDVRVPRGGSLLVRARSDKALRRGHAQLGTAEPIAAVLGEDGRSLRVELQPQESGVLELDVVDTDELGCRTPPRVFVRVVEDQRPGVTFAIHGVGSMITAVARIPGRVTLRDDYGLATAQGWLRITEERTETSEEPLAPPDFEPAPFEGLGAMVEGAPEFTSEVLLDLRQLAPDAPAEQARIRPGQTLALKLTATDRTPPPAQEGASEVVTLRVVTRDKLLEDLQRRQAEQRRELHEVRTTLAMQRDELATIVSPAAADPRAAKAADRLRTLARDLRSLGRRAGGVSERYAVIVAEMLNNRLFEPNEIGSLTDKIVTPLARVAAEDFPNCATRTADFATDGDEATRAGAVGLCDSILLVVDQVLAQMQEAETLAALLETLRQVIRLEDEAIRGVEQRVRELGSQIFGPDQPAADPQKGDGRKE